MEEDKEVIFEPFRQVGERLQHSEGTGLGLAISRQLVRLMGGKLQLTSPVDSRIRQLKTREGMGSCFYFSIEVPILRNDLSSGVPPGIVSTDIQKDLAVPPLEILNELADLVEVGEVQGINEKIMKIRELESGKYHSFGKCLQELADEFQFTGLLNCIAEQRKRYEE
ncbi:MAG: hypothetical protein D3924_13935 [Candidatus Electrothrix sp. AR4]|nr:hypothetical protein [Candidatus Electrothrix sp. AR4]